MSIFAPDYFVTKISNWPVNLIILFSNFRYLLISIMPLSEKVVIMSKNNKKGTQFQHTTKTRMTLRVATNDTPPKLLNKND